MAKSASFHSPNPSMALETPTTAVQKIILQLEKHGAEQLQVMTIATLDALEQVHGRPRGRPSVQHKGQVHIYFD